MDILLKINNLLLKNQKKKKKNLLTPYSCCSILWTSNDLMTRKQNMNEQNGKKICINRFEQHTSSDFRS